MPLRAENREAGENPARARHCKREAPAYATGTCYREGAGERLIRKSGDLPRTKIDAQRGRSVVIRICLPLGMPGDFFWGEARSQEPEW